MVNNDDTKNSTHKVQHAEFGVSFDRRGEEGEGEGEGEGEREVFLSIFHVL